jgi:hypothetical protein
VIIIIFKIKKIKNPYTPTSYLLLYQFARRAIKLTVIIIEEYPLPTSHKFLSNILLSRLSLYVDEIIGDHQCGV